MDTDLKSKKKLSITGLILKGYFILLLFSVILVPFLGGLIFNETSTFQFKELWMFLSNIIYFSLFIYILVKLGIFIKKLLRNEIQGKSLSIFGIGFLKFFLFFMLIPFTWFIGQFFASIINFIYIVVIELGKEFSGS